MAKVSPKLAEAGEKSPNVHYANWKEDILLKKQLHVLDRSEKSIVHRIKIDQKVLFKRFQNKLLRSKLGQARMWGDKERERELRARNLQGLHTDLGDVEKDYHFLKKLVYNPCTADGPTKTPVFVNPNSKPKRERKSAKIAKNQIDVIIDEVFDSAENVRKPRERSNSVTEGMMQKSDKPGKKMIDSKSLGIPPVVLLVRPATTDGRPSRDSVQTYPHRATTGMSSKPPRIPSTNKVAPGKVLGQNTDGTTAVEKKSHIKSSSFFEEEEKINYAEQRLKEMKSITYDDRIKSFYETIENLTSDDQAHADYYTIRLQAASKESRRPLTTVPGTPEEDYQRHLGNLDVRSLTFKSLNLEFSKKDHISQDAFRPDLPTAVVADSSDDYSDSDSDED